MRKTKYAAERAALLRIAEVLGIDPVPAVTVRRGSAFCTLRDNPLLRLGCARRKDFPTDPGSLFCTLLAPTGDESFPLRSDGEEAALLTRLRKILSIDSDAAGENAAPHPYSLKVTVLEEQPGGDGWQSLGETTVEI